MVQKAPAWKGKHGPSRILAEFKSLGKELHKGQFPAAIHDLRLVEDNLNRWRFSLKDFDSTHPGGAQLNQDLAVMKQQCGQDCIVMEITFPEDYPTQPFFIRVVSPRCVWYTGHVTAGGSICIEALTLSNTRGYWSSEMGVESILQVVLLNMVDCESVWVQTRTGPGGLSGPLRIDLQHRYHHQPFSEYSEAEAKAAFDRTLQNHRKVGW